MIFAEKKTAIGYEYMCDDVFGSVDIYSTEKLKGETLDDIVSYLLGQNIQAETVEGTVVVEENTIMYKFKKISPWAELDKNEPCTNTPTSTKQAVKEFIATRLKAIPLLNWSLRFVEAFREAWRNARK